MIIQRVHYVLIVVGVIVSDPCSAGIFGPNSFDECITESMKGVKSDTAAQAIYQSCRNQFPKKPTPRHPERALTATEVEKVSFSPVNLYESSILVGQKRMAFTVHNGNADIVLTSFGVKIQCKKGSKWRTYSPNTGMAEYADADHPLGFDELKPLASAQVWVDYLDDGDSCRSKTMNWNYTNLRGYTSSRK